MTKLFMVAAFALLPLAAPALAEGARVQNVNDRIADQCTVSDVDLVGKRLARTCRAEVRSRWEQEQRLASAKPQQAGTIRVALGK